MNLKRIVSASLALALAVCLAVPPAAAAGASFVDVSGDDAVNADVLRLMGVVSGTGDNRFDPGGILTRAQFCAMVVNFLQKGDQVPMYSSRTIFSDVTASHWGIGYVNLAASLTVKDGDRETALVSGVGDGRFQPDERITLAEAVTILLRGLGYTSARTGTLWPHSFLALASSIGLTEGVDAGASDSLTRAKAARLFVNALRCETGAGADYYTTIGTAQEDALVLAVDVKTDDGSRSGAVRTSGGTYLPKQKGTTPSALQGRRGALVLNDQKEIVAFAPDDTRSVTLILDERAQPSYVRSYGNRQYAVSGDTKVYTSDKTDGESYSTAYTGLYAGSQVTLFTDQGKVVAIYAVGTATTAPGDAADAVVITQGAGSAVLDQLTGGATGYTILKSREPISTGGIKRYDVVTYDALTNTMIVSDLHLSCILESATPNVQAPTTITALGHQFPVLESAWADTPNFRVGQEVTLLLTADGRVAGLADPQTVRSNAVGTVTSGGATVFLPNGGTLSLSGTVPSGDRMQNRLVVVSSGSKGKIGANPLAERNVSGSLDLGGMKLGSYTVAAGVRIYEQADGGPMAEVDRSALGVGDIPGSQIAAYHLNNANMVDYIVLDNATGAAYVYGKLTSKHLEGAATDAWTLDRSSPVEFSAKYGYGGKKNIFVGVSTRTDSEGKPTIWDVVELTQVKGVRSEDFYEYEGAWYVKKDSQTWRVSDQVECCWKTGADEDGEEREKWFTQTTGSARLDAVRAYADSGMSLYVDPIGHQVRIIEAN